MKFGSHVHYSKRNTSENVRFWHFDVAVQIWKCENVYCDKRPEFNFTLNELLWISASCSCIMTGLTLEIPWKYAQPFTNLFVLLERQILESNWKTSHNYLVFVGTSKLSSHVWFTAIVFSFFSKHAKRIIWRYHQLCVCPNQCHWMAACHVFLQLLFIFWYIEVLEIMCSLTATCLIHSEHHSECKSVIFVVHPTLLGETANVCQQSCLLHYLPWGVLRLTKAVMFLEKRKLYKEDPAKEFKLFVRLFWRGTWTFLAMN